MSQVTREWQNTIFQPHPDNEEWTIFTQRATLNIISFFGIEAQVEKLGIKAYHKNIKKVRFFLLN